MPDHPMSDEERVIRVLNRWTFAHYEKQVFSDLPDAAQAVLAALGPQLTAEEAKHMLTTYVFPPCSDCDAIRAKLSLIAKGEKP